MQSNRCNQECDYFKWSEHGANYKAYCLKSSKHIKDIGACPLKWAASVVITNDDQCIKERVAE